MKSVLKTLSKFFAAFVIAYVANASAGDIQFKIEEFYDQSASLQIEQIKSEKFTSNSGKIRKPYQKGNLWLRVSIEAYQPNLFLYFENATVDEILIVVPDQDTKGLWKTNTIPTPERLRGHLLTHTMDSHSDGKSEFYLRVKSLSTKQFNVKVLTEAETQNSLHIRYAILSSQMTAAVVLLIWVVMQNWLARSKIFIAVMLSVPLFVLSRLNYFGLFLEPDDSNAVRFLNLNMVMFLALISCGTLMVKESFGRLFTRTQNRVFFAAFAFSLLPSIGLFWNVPRAYLVAGSLGLNFLMIMTLYFYLATNLGLKKKLIWNYKYQLAIFVTYSIMSMGPGLYFVAPQIFPFELGIPAFRDHFYPVLAFLIMILMLNEQKEKEMDSIFTLAVTKANTDIEIEKNKKQHVFLGMLLHEIKTPLSVIKFGADALKNPNSDNAKNLIWVERVDDAVDAINHILNQCLLADKFEFGLSGYKAETLEIYAELSKIIDRVGLLNPTYPERINWHFSDQLPKQTLASVDPIFLRSILENLLSNALKYSAPNSKVDLKIFEHQSGNGSMFKFEIKNQIGKVGPPDMGKLFSRYYRSEEARGYSGTGLGLWLANQQAKEMGSNIDCEFDDTWTTFSFQVPILNTPT
jgi:signal transduction histidine kinase